MFLFLSNMNQQDYQFEVCANGVDSCAALVWQPEIAHMTRMHNDANVLVLPGRYMDKETAWQVLDEFFNTEFEGGRHVRRIEKIPVE